MRHHRVILAIVFAGLITTWGCNRSSSQPNASPVSASVHAKVAQLEQKLKEAHEARDRAQQQFRDLDAKFQKQTAQLRSVENERDELKTQLLSRTGERDALQTHFDGFRKNLKEMLNQADAAYLPGSPPTSSPTAVPSFDPFGLNLLPFPKGS